MPFRFIKVNKAKCRHCGNIVISDTEDRKLAAQKNTCPCGRLTTYGGGTSLVRTGVQGVDYDELSVMSFDDCPAVKSDIQDPPPNQDAILGHLRNNKK